MLLRPFNEVYKGNVMHKINKANDENDLSKKNNLK